MGMVHAEITLINVKDEEFAKAGYIKIGEIRSVTVTATADSGSMYLVITEEIFRKLGLDVKGEKIAHCANGQRVKCKLTSPVNIIWKDRDISLPAVVVPGAEKVLLGALALEGMDLMINPVTQELVGVHGDKVEIYTLKAS